MNGLILKGIGGFYYILSGGTTYECKARGKFRMDRLSPLPGDMAEFEVDSEGRGYILSILPRKNVLIRPAVANVDRLMFVLSASIPKPDLLMADRLFIQCESAGIEPVLIQNKCDDGDGDYLYQYEGTGYPLIHASAVNAQGLDDIKALISGHTCCFAGQSAVGKSSILNALLPELCLETGGLSHKTERGKHTTRHAELWSAFGGTVADTPGFSLLETAQMEPHELASFYPEMRDARKNCRFPECLHKSEPDCAVKPLIGNGVTSERYERYLILLEELKEMRKHKYD